MPAFRQTRFLVLAVLIALGAMACNPSSTSQSEIDSGASTGEDQQAQDGGAAAEDGEVLEEDAPTVPSQNALLDQVESGQLELSSLEATAEEINGPIMMLQVTNPTDQEVLVTIPCGFIFQPDDEDEQRMMVIQPSELALPAGEEGVLEPYVICVDLDKAGPIVGSSYSLGLIAGEDLLKLAQCVCAENLAALADEDFNSIFALQMVVWLTSSGQDDIQSMFEEISQEEGNALGDVSEEEYEEFLDLLQNTMQEPIAAWLAQCDLQPEP